MARLEFKMPKMGESITEATIINWLIKEGDSFDEGDILLEVATDKVANEIPAPTSGSISEIKFQAKDVVPVGEIIAVLEVSEDITKTEKRSSEPANEKNVKQDGKISRPISQQKVSPESFSVNNTNTYYSPLIVKIAKEHHISFEELARIPSTGSEGRLRKSDLFQYIEDGRP